MPKYVSKYKGHEIDERLGLAGTALQEHQDISGKQDVIEDLEAIREGAKKGESAIQSDDLNRALKTKQDVIEDLAQIRSGASKGTTAVQPSSLASELSRKQDVITDLARIRTGAALGITSVQKGAGVSQLVNDAGFITRLVSDLENYYDKHAVDEKISAIVGGFSIKVVDVLPSASEETKGAIYLVPSASAKEGNIKDEYITIEENGVYKWERIGSTAIDLSDYYTKEQINDKISILATKGELGTLAQIVSNKADSSVVEDIAEEVENKADKSELSALDEKVETTRLATDLSNLDADGRGVIEGIAKERVFWATYGKTTYDDIVNAYNDGKEVKMSSGSYIYRVSQFAPEQNVVRFNSLNTEISRMAQVTSENRWSVFTYPFEKTDHRQNVLTASETNYPSSKGVMDYVAEQIRDFAKVTPTLTSGTKIADVESGGSVVPLYAPNGSGGSEWHSVLLSEADYNADVKGFLIDVGEGNEIAEAKIAGQMYTEEPNASAQNVLVGFGYRLDNLTSPYQCFAYFSLPADRNFLNFYGTGESFEIGLRGTRKVYTQGGLLRYSSHIRPSGEFFFDSNAQTDASKSTYVYDGYNNPRYFGIKNLWNSVAWARIRIEYRLR